jgi:hypothetical protein
MRKKLGMFLFFQKPDAFWKDQTVHLDFQENHLAALIPNFCDASKYQNNFKNLASAAASRRCCASV